MRYRLFIIFLFFTACLFGQSGFHINESKEKVVIPFTLINNLIFIPVKVNDVQLNFLLDTGVNQTVLFSLDESNELKLNKVEKLKLQGLGTNEPIDAYRSSQNSVEINDYIDLNHEIYIILDQEFNFSSHIGIPVNGIIGSGFFKNHFVEIDYDKKKVIVYRMSNKKIIRKIKNRFRENSISIEEDKPYYVSEIKSGGKSFHSKLLIDTGNSDALWIFLNKTDSIKLPEKHIDDYLGQGFSGSIYGKRGRIDKYEFGKIFFESPLVAFPDSSSVKRSSFVSERVGSVGGEVVSRFNVVFDYENQKIYTRTNSRIGKPFHFNMSGIEVEHAGLEWVKETYEGNQPVKISVSSSEESNQENLKVRFKLKPVFIIASVRVNSEAEKAGVKREDKILKINNRDAHGYTIQKVNELLKSEEGKDIELEIEREGKIHKFRFQLKSII